jgi:hypothetical protein
VKAVLVGNFPPEYIEQLDLLQLNGLLDAIDVVEAERRKAYVVDTNFGAQADDKGINRHFKALDKRAGVTRQANPDDYVDK